MLVFNDYEMIARHDSNIINQIISQKSEKIILLTVFVGIFYSNSHEQFQNFVIAIFEWNKKLQKADSK